MFSHSRRTSSSPRGLDRVGDPQQREAALRTGWRPASRGKRRRPRGRRRRRPRSAGPRGGREHLPGRRVDQLHRLAGGGARSSPPIRFLVSRTLVASQPLTSGDPTTGAGPVSSDTWRVPRSARWPRGEHGGAARPLGQPAGTASGASVDRQRRRASRSVPPGRTAASTSGRSRGANVVDVPARTGLLIDGVWRGPRPDARRCTTRGAATAAQRAGRRRARTDVDRAVAAAPAACCARRSRATSGPRSSTGPRTCWPRDRDHLAGLIALEAAKPIAGARAEVDRGVQTLRFSAAEARTLEDTAGPARRPPRPGSAPPASSGATRSAWSRRSRRSTSR